jgi:integrase
MSASHSIPTGPAAKPPTALQPPTTAGGKPAKPYPEFPLTAHPAGYWCKKIRGKLHYFGPWSDPDGALKKYLAEKDDLHAGREPRAIADPEALTVKDVANAFLNAKDALLNAGELSPRTRAEYQAMSDAMVAHFGKGRLVSDLRPDDFASLRNKLAKKWGPHRLKKAIQYIRSILKHAYDSDLIDRPIRFGPGFKRPSMKTLRLHRARKGAKLFTADEIREMVHGTLVVGTDGPELVQPGAQLKAMILLGINCGFGNADCGNLPLSAVDLEGGLIDFPRPKTRIPRRCALWPETVAALRDALAHRPEPKDAAHAGLVFITKYGQSWFKTDSVGPLVWETRKLLNKLGINSRKGLGFYTLRHTFRTVADESKDQPAVDYSMGHEVPHMSSIYRETISDERLKAVADHVRVWLFGPQQANQPSATN